MDNREKRVVLFTCALMLTEKKKNKRTIWSKIWYFSRNMSSDAKLLKESLRQSEAISAKNRFIATLRFLTSGRSFEDMKFQLLGKIIMEMWDKFDAFIGYVSLRLLLSYTFPTKNWKNCAKEELFTQF